MADDSSLDARYFVDAHVYNCPFCNRRHVAYYIAGSFVFDWTDDKKCKVIFARCASCENTSMHLTFESVALEHVSTVRQQYRYRFKDIADDAAIDELFFYSVPTSFFVLDSRVPRVLRELMTEAEGCLKSNFLTGASACARKMIYELAALQKATGDNHEERLKSLKSKLPDVDPAFF